MTHQILCTVVSTINNYSLIDKSESSILAYSGGKDSTLLLYILKSLGYRITPVIIDMGYKFNWASSIEEHARKLGYDPIIIRTDDAIKKLINSNQNLYKELKCRSEFLFSLVDDRHQNVTPCTECYNIKITLLCNYAIQNNINNIIFGHHAVDAIGSFLKSLFYYIDRMDMQNEVYIRENYESVLRYYYPIFLKTIDGFKKTDLYKKMSYLTIEKKISTDEPPLNIYHKDGKAIRIVRPLFNIYENQIIDYLQFHKISYDDMPCGHRLKEKYETPREMIHSTILKNLFYTRQGQQILDILLEFCKLGLDSVGAVKFDTRKNRNLILGTHYKNNMGHNLKL